MSDAISAADRIFLRSLDHDGGGRVDRDAALQAIDGSVNGERDGRIDSLEADTFVASASARGVSPELARSVVQLALAAAPSIDFAKRQGSEPAVRRLPGWLNTREVSPSALGIAAGRSYTATLRDDRDNLLLVSVAIKDRPSLQDVEIRIARAAAPDDFDPEQIKVSKALLEDVGVLLHRALERQELTVGRSERQLLSAAAESEPDVEALDPVEDVRATLAHWGELLKLIAAAAGPE
jgi:hypothetical protein